MTCFSPRDESFHQV